MLVDAQLTERSERVLQEIKETHKHFRSYLITHGTPITFLVWSVQGSIPRCEIWRLQRSCVESKRSIRRKSISGNSSCPRMQLLTFVPIDPSTAAADTFDGSHIEVLQHIQGDTDEKRCFWIPNREFSSLAISCSMTCSGTRRNG